MHLREEMALYFSVQRMTLSIFQIFLEPVRMSAINAENMCLYPLDMNGQMYRNSEQLVVHVGCSVDMSCSSSSS